MNRNMIHGSFVHKETRSLNFEDQDAIDAAALPNLEPISLEILAQTVTATRANGKVIWQAILIFAVVLVVAVLSKGYTFALALGSAILVMLIGAFILHLRTQLDETAVMMRIPVHHTEDKGTRSYAVCYLPDGKYLFRYDGNQFTPEIVCYIEFGKFTYCQFERAANKPAAAPEESADSVAETEEDASAPENPV